MKKSICKLLSVFIVLVLMTTVLITGCIVKEEGDKEASKGGEYYNRHK